MNLFQKLLRKPILSFSLFFITFYNLSAQNVKNFTLADGLAGNSILCIFKDSSGLLWIGTETGLCTYDGLNFKTIGEEQGLKYNIVRKIIEDDKKNLWLSVFGDGIAKFDGKKFTYYNNKDGLINNSVRSMYFSKKDNCLVLGTEEGLSVFNGKEFKNFLLKPNNHAGNFQVNFITTFEDKIIFGVNYEYLYELRIDKTNIKKSEIQKYYFPDTQNYTGFIEGDNFYSRNPNREFVVHDLKNKTITNLGECPTIWEIVQTENKVIYASGWEVNYPKGGLLKVKNGKITDLSSDLKLPTSKFWCLYYDLPTKQLWAGSVDQGIFVIDLSNKISIETNLFYENNEIKCLFIDNQNNLWLGGNNFIVKKNKSEVKTLTNENLRKQILNFRKKIAKDTESFKNNLHVTNKFTCYRIKQDEDGVIWAFTNYGILRLDQDFNLLDFYIIAETGGILDFVDSNNLIVSQNYSYSHIVPKNNLPNHKPIIYQGKPIYLNATKITKENSNLWIATKSKGFFLFRNGEIISLNDLGFYQEKNLTDVIVDRDGNIISTTQNGKVIFSKWNNNELTHFKILKPEIDIIGNSVFFVRQYKEYYIIGTNKGINIVKDFKLHKFLSKEEHLLATEYTDAVIDNRSNTLLISTYKGLISIDLSKAIQIEKFNSPIYLNRIKINNEDFPVTSELNLDYDKNNIEINFNSNNILNATKNYYRYKILGLSNYWSKYTKDSNLKLLGLKSGNYIIVLEGKNIGTGETLKPIQIKINIRYPFWETWRFILCCAIVLFVIVFIGYKKRVQFIAKREQAKGEVQKRLAETKMEALQSQMNPHFIFNAMNSIQNYIIDYNTDEALMYMGEFSKLIRQTLENSSKQRISLSNEIDYLQSYIKLENMRFKNKVIIDLDIDDNIDLFETDIPPMLIQPFVENVFVHAFDSQSVNPTLTLSFKLMDNFILCEIKDNGKGMVSENLNKIHTSKGIKLAKERIAFFQPDAKNAVSIVSVQKEGTTIVLRIQIDN